jgi:hypothetical protein
LTLAVFTASLPPDKFFAELSPQSRVDSMIRALEIIDGTNCAEASDTLALRSAATRAWFDSGHFTDISSLPRAGVHSGAEPSHDFTVPPASRAGGTDTVARE